MFSYYIRLLLLHIPLHIIAIQCYREVLAYSSNLCKHTVRMIRKEPVSYTEHQISDCIALSRLIMEIVNVALTENQEMQVYTSTFKFNYESREIMSLTRILSLRTSVLVYSTKMQYSGLNERTGNQRNRIFRFICKFVCRASVNCRN